MAPRLAEAWSNRAHGTSTSHNAMILAQLRITEAGIATAEAYQTKITLELANLNCEMATLRRMLEAQLSSSTAPSSSPTVKHHSIAAISLSTPSTLETPRPYVVNAMQKSMHVSENSTATYARTSKMAQCHLA